MFKKLKFIFIFLSLICIFGITFSLTTFSLFNSNSFFSSTHNGNVKREKRQIPSPTKVDWNAHMTKIKPVLKILADFNKPITTFMIGDLGNKKKYSVTNLIKPQNIDAKYSAMSSNAQQELKDLYKDGIDNIKLITAYELVLDDFFQKIKHHLKTLFEPFLITQFKITGSSGVVFQVDNLIKTINWKTDNLARTELIALYKYSSDYSVIIDGIVASYKITLGSYLTALYSQKELLASYKIIFDPFLQNIKPALQVFKVMENKEITIGTTIYQIENLTTVLDKNDWETNAAACKELSELYKFNSVSQTLKKQLQTAYKAILEPFLIDIKPTLQVLNATGIQNVTINGTNYQISNLIANFQTPNWETNLDASKELAALYKHNSYPPLLKKELEDASKLLLSNFLTTIKPALQVLEAMGSQKIRIGVIIYQIDNLLTTLDTNGWETNLAANKELTALYKLNSDGSIVLSELQTAYKVILNPFLTSIKPALTILWIIGSNKVMIKGTNYPIGNLVVNFKTSSWETNSLASKELAALYKHNPHGPTVLKELQTAYKAILNRFLQET